MRLVTTTRYGEDWSDCRYPHAWYSHLDEAVPPQPVTCLCHCEKGLIVAVHAAPHHNEASPKKISCNKLQYVIVPKGSHYPIRDLLHCYLEHLYSARVMTSANVASVLVMICAEVTFRGMLSFTPVVLLHIITTEFWNVFSKPHAVHFRVRWHGSCDTFPLHQRKVFL